MSTEEETLRNARARIEATRQISHRRIHEDDAEVAAKILADLWLTFAKHGATDDILRGVVDVPSLSITVAQSIGTHRYTLASVASGQLRWPLNSRNAGR